MGRTERGGGADPAPAAGDQALLAARDTGAPAPPSGSRVGGSSARGFVPSRSTELLPGYDQCPDVPWLSEDKTEVTIQPGDSATVDVSLDAGTITQPGTYDAHLTVSAKTPYGTSPLPVSLTVNPPKTWSKITGTVTGVGCVGTPAPPAATTVQINAKAAAYTLKTDRNGQYTLWLDSHDNPLTVIASKDGWTSQSVSAKITPQKTTTVDFTLTSDRTCS